MASSWYPYGLQDALGGGNFSSGTMKVLLVNASGTFNEAHDFVNDVTANELSGGTYVRKTLASKTINVDTGNNRVYLDAADVTWTALAAGGATIGAAIVFREVTNDTDSIPWLFLDPNDLVTNGGDVTLQFDASTGLGYIGY